MPKDDKKKEFTGFSEEERAAMRERVKELKVDKLDGEGAIQAKIAEMPEPDRSMATRLHALVKENAPLLVPRTWYGMPAYSNADAKVVFFFKPASKFGSRYNILGFNDAAKLDDGNMWPDSYAILEMNGPEEARIAELIKKAIQ